MPITPAFNGEERLALSRLNDDLSAANVDRYLSDNPGLVAGLNHQNRGDYLQMQDLQSPEQLRDLFGEFRDRVRGSMCGGRFSEEDRLSSADFEGYYQFETEFDLPMRSFMNITAFPDRVQVAAVCESGQAVWSFPVQDCADHICELFVPKTVSGDDLRNTINQSLQGDSADRDGGVSVFSGAGFLYMAQPQAGSNSSTTVRFPWPEYRLRDTSTVNGRSARTALALDDNLRQRASEGNDSQIGDVDALQRTVRAAVCGACPALNTRAPTENVDTVPVDAFVRVTTEGDVIRVAAVAEGQTMVWELPRPVNINMNLFKQGITDNMDVEWAAIADYLVPAGMDKDTFLQTLFNATRNSERRQEGGFEVYAGPATLSLVRTIAENQEVFLPPLPQYIQPLEASASVDDE